MNRFSTLFLKPILSAAGKNPAPPLMTIAVVVLLLALSSWAQRGGGGAGGRGGGFAGGVGAAGGHGGHVGTGASPRATPGRPGFSHPSHRPSNGPGHSHGSNDRFQSSRFGRNRFPNCWGYNCWAWNNPWWGYYPWWGGYDPYSEQHDRDQDYDSADSDRERQDAQMAPPWAGYGPPYPYMPPPPNATHPAAAEPQAGTPIIPPTVLVFRDRRRQEVNSYAIVGQMLWNFTSPQQIEKISLSDLDLAATVKANSERGRSFRIPSAQRGAGEGPAVPSNT